MSDVPLFTPDAPALGPKSEVSTSESAGPSYDQVLYRRWRPQSFAEVYGQDSVTRTLRNSIAAGNLAHAYLFCGPRGTGKTTLGRLLAKAANCEAPVDGEPCNQCPSCVAYISGRAMDFVEQDAASHNSVDDIRQLRENVVLAPMSGRRKVYLLDEVHMLSTAAQNALLKTLEEPPPHIIFVLATTEPHKVTPTVISRCQRFDLKRIPNASVVQRLTAICENEGFELGHEALTEIARAATGSLRDAIMALQQLVSEYGNTPSLDQVQDALGLKVDARSGEFALLALSGNLAAALTLVARVRDDGVDPRLFTRQVVQYFRGLTMVTTGAPELLDLPQDLANDVRERAKQVSAREALRALRAFGTIDWKRADANGVGGSLPLELALADFVAQRPAEEAAVAPPKKGTQFSVPVAGMDAVEATVADARVEAAVVPKASEGEDEGPPRAEDTAGNDLLERVRGTLKENDKQAAALLNGSCDIKDLDGDKVVLGFYHTFHLERVETGGYRGAIERAFAAVLGRPVSVEYVHAPRGPADEKPRRPGGHLVQAAREKYGARAVPGND